MKHSPSDYIIVNYRGEKMMKNVGFDQAATYVLT